MFLQMQLRKCAWLNYPPLVCAHGRDSTNAFPNTVSFGQARTMLLRMERQRREEELKNRCTKKGQEAEQATLNRATSPQTGAQQTGGSLKSMKDKSGQADREEKEGSALKTAGPEGEITAVWRVILDAKVGPPSHEKGLAKDILSVFSTSHCTRTCTDVFQFQSLDHPLLLAALHFIWVKLLQISFQSKAVGYIVMLDPSTGTRSNLLRIKGARVVGVYRPLIDEKLVKILHGRNKKVYAWTVDDADSMQRMLFERVDGVVTSNPTLFQHTMQDVRRQCLDEGFLWHDDSDM
ncbi:glycerophosphodiester phosphodiesterase GDPD4-like [Tripterygium wilfordii]|uniref:glycerophosphodiester phosphodiesterase GDPD4-like n=1 Tax=Tripterygium wilfordii TaxID=458696 RepID=UPI0018F7EEE3|nr:glycerophosphodiester phosphodiesterase GDPD4-like [Tripterygium wilfordii]